jgi:translocation and assembly module TamA
MHRIAVLRRTVAVSLLTLVLGLAPPRSLAADPPEYTVVLKPTGDAALDAAVHDSSTLVALREKSPVGGFALMQRARSDADVFEQALRSFGYYDGTVSLTIDGHPLDDPALVGEIENTSGGALGEPGDNAQRAKIEGAPPLPVAVAIDPGPRFHLGQITIEGALPPSLGSPLGLTREQDALAASVLAARDRLLNALREAGYPLATVTMPPAVLRRDRRELDVSFQVQTGPHAALGEIRFEGLRQVSEKFMRDRLLLRPGEQFKPSAIEAARQNLLSAGVFSSVRIVPADKLDAAGNLPLVVDVEEAKLHSVDFGASWSTDLGAGVNAAWRHRDLFGGAEQLNLTAAVQLGGDATTKPGARAGIEFVKPDFQERNLTLNVSLSGVKQSLVAYDQTAAIERTGVAWKLSPHWSVQAGLLGEEESVLQEDVRRPYDFAGVPFTAKYDSTKSLLEPASGIRSTLSLTPVRSFGPSGATYLIAQASASAYLDPRGNGRSTIAVRGLVGQVSGAGVFGLPPDQRLYAGGSDTVRGYRYQSIGPRFADGNPTGGTAVSAATFEFRQRFLEHWGTAAFVDVGQASADGKPFSANWHAGAGTGLRYYTPIGPIRLDFAVPLVREHGEDSFEVYVGIGEAF